MATVLNSSVKIKSNLFTIKLLILNETKKAHEQSLSFKAPFMGIIQ